MDKVYALLDFTHYWCVVREIRDQRWVSSQRASNVAIDLFFVVILIKGLRQANETLMIGNDLTPLLSGVINIV